MTKEVETKRWYVFYSDPELFYADGMKFVRKLAGVKFTID